MLWFGEDGVEEKLCASAVPAGGTCLTGQFSAAGRNYEQCDTVTLGTSYGVPSPTWH